MAASEDSGHEPLHGLQPMGVLTGDFNLHKANIVLLYFNSKILFRTIPVFKHLDT